jgi:hypothetical protein
MERAGKRIPQIDRQEKCAFFGDKVLQKCMEMSSGKGLIAKISAYNLYQRKLL